MKQTKRILSVLLALLLLAVSIPHAFAATLNYSSKKIYYGKTVKLQVQDGKASSWTSSNPAIATVNRKGVVKGVGIGTAVIKAKVGKQTLSCKVKVNDRNVNAAVTFATNTGGVFIGKVNKAVIKITPQTYNVGKATVYVLDAADRGVYKTTLKDLKKNETVTVNWDGRDGRTKSGQSVPDGTYTAVVKIGKAVSKSEPLAFVQKNFFAGGDGSAKNPFKIATTDQLRQIVRYPNACFQQINDLDYEYESVGGFFSTDNPFNGTYNGNGRTISNITANAPLFNCIGERGQVKSLNMRKCSIIAYHAAVLCDFNYGKVLDCDIDGITSYSDGGALEIRTSIVVADNHGTISNCTASGSATVVQAGDWAKAGGIAAYNAAEGKIIDCESSAKIQANGPMYRGNASPNVGGICGENDGFITSCSSTSDVSANAGGVGGIAGQNNNQVTGCSYLGNSAVGLVGGGNGVVA